MFIEFIPQIVNLIIAGANIYWSLQLKGIQSSRALMDSYKQMNQEKDETINKQTELIEELKKKKEQYKVQYFTAHSKLQQMEGQLQAYQNIHKT